MKVVLITGASSGIGRELAKEFARHGHDLLLVARRENRLTDLEEELKSSHDIQVDHFACDIAKDPRAVYDYCQEKNYSVPVLINNAGYGDYGSFAEADLDKLSGMIDLNNKALMTLTYLFLQDMKKQGYGHIINTGSVASFLPGPYMAVYYATKAFVLSFSMALREELKKENIRVSVLCPAPTKSEFWKVADGETSVVFDNFLARNSEDAARTGYEIYEKNKAYAVDGRIYDLLIRAARFMPIEMTARAVGFIQSKTKNRKK